ncbi:plasmid pRiA4b ORF-3 family protein [Saccharothrix yanglingensis]|nr:plasmid pRiA4b ORF-3 family protein [Saccharothrix yanglingensis]
MSDPTLADLRASLAADGAPEHVLELVDDSTDIDDALERLAAAGVTGPPVSALLDGFTPLLEQGCGPLDAELSGSDFLGVVIDSVAPEDLHRALTAVVSDGEATGSPEALAMARVLAVLAPAPVRDLARAAADRLVAGGLRDPRWVKAVGKPAVGECFGYTDPHGAQQGVALTFSYGRKVHVLVVLIDHDLGGGVKDCFVTDRPKEIRAGYEQAAEQHGMVFRVYPPEQARAIVADALDREPCPVEPDQVEDVRAHVTLLRQRVELLPEAPRTPADTSVHRLKITLSGSKPPIWRRLEVPSTIPLVHLHRAVQDAFEWEDCHLWVFHTPAGDYGVHDPELGHGDATAVTLADVAPTPKTRLTYLYDFGDDWDHDILVEDVAQAEPGAAYPRCLTGRRAAPPEDCGGIPGYDHLCEVLADPFHPEHAELLEWLELDDPADFDPAAFDRDELNDYLAAWAKVLVKP